MAKANLQIIVDAKDNASGVLGRIGGAIGSLGTLAAGAALSGVVALGAGIVSSIGAAMEAQDALADLEATIESTGGVAGVTADYAQALALGLQDVTRFSDDAIIAGQAMLLTFTNIGKDVFPMATEATLNMAQKLKTDPVQAAMMLGKALNDPIAGVTALRRVGVQLTDAQEETIQKMVALNDVAGAQKIILGELETEFGGAAVAAGTTAAGQMDILINRFGEFQEQIGGAFLPLITLVQGKLFEWQDSGQAKAALDAITGGIQGVVDVITPLAEGNAMLALQNFQHLLMNFGFSSEQISSVTEGINSIVESADRIGAAFGRMFGVEGVSGIDAVVMAFENIASAVEIIAGAVTAVERVVNAVSGSGAGRAVGAVASAIQISPSEVGSFVRPQPAGFQPSSAPAGGFGGQFGGSMDFGPFITAIANAITGAPPPVVNVSANLDGAQIANSVSVRLGGDAQGLNRIGGHVPMR